MKNLVFVFLAAILPWTAHAQYNGVPFANDAALCSFASDDVSPAQRAVIAQTMGQHLHRLYHWLWHTTRNSWSELSPSDRNVIQQLSPQWGANAPVCPAPNATNGNPAGEEFLRMHHQMIDYLRSQLVAAGLPCINGWSAIPRAGDPQWPVPPGASDDSSKSAEMDRLLQVWASTFKDVTFLRTHTLSQVGYLLEFSIHNNLHMRWSALPKAGDDFSPSTAQSLGALLADSPFDGASYNYLGNPYSAAVNPVFWKVHGWVDNVIVAWLAANGYSAIADNCSALPNGQSRTCYQWRSQWIGGMEHAQAAAPSGPVGGGVPAEGMQHDHSQMQMGSGAPTLPGLSRTLSNLSQKNTFRNRAFDQFLSQPRGGAGPGSRGGPASQPYDDPAVFVQNFGPCSTIPAFLR